MNKKINLDCYFHGVIWKIFFRNKQRKRRNTELRQNRFWRRNMFVQRKFSIYLPKKQGEIENK